MFRIFIINLKKNNNKLEEKWKIGNIIFIFEWLGLVLMISGFFFKNVLLDKIETLL